MTDPRATIPQGLAKAVIRSLTRGTTVSEGVRFLHVGHRRWLGAQEELLDEVADDGFSDTKFVRGAYGSGKSHFLAVVQDVAREKGWATSHVECKADSVQIDRFETIYPKLLDKMKLPLVSSPSVGPALRPVEALLATWCTRLYRDAGLREDGGVRPFDADDKIYKRLEADLLRSTLPAPFVKSLVCFARARFSNDRESMSAIVEWLQGGQEKIRLRKRYLLQPSPGATKTDTGKDFIELRPLREGTSQDALRGILWLIRAAGFAGVVLCIDEVEELAKLGSQKRMDQALQSLREHVDHAGGDSGYRYLCLYLAATPEMFENQAYFPRYDALATRIQPLGREINWRAPVVDLDKTPLTGEEMLEMATRIKEIHQVAFPAIPVAAVSEDLLKTLVEGVVAARYRTAKPRLLARLVVDELERARQQGEDYEPPQEVASKLLSIERASS